MRPEHQDKISDAYKAFLDQEGFARVVNNNDILALGGNLSLARYIQRPISGGDDYGHTDLVAAWSLFEEDSESFWQEMGGLVAMLNGVSEKGARND